VRRYRFCLFDQFGEVRFADVFECADDDAAKAFLSKQILGFPSAHGFELWDLNRLVLAGLTAKHRSKVRSPKRSPTPSLDARASSSGGSPKQNPATFDPFSLRSNRLRAAYVYWLGKRNGRPMPSRSDIDPTEIPTLLPYVTLIDVLAEPLDFRYRLIGTGVRSISRRDYTGLLFSEVEGKGRDSVLWHGCEVVVQSKVPSSHSPPYVGSDAFVRNCENILLPLSDDLVNVTMILKVISFERARMSGTHSNTLAAQEAR
jgi:hypothetical protein